VALVAEAAVAAVDVEEEAVGAEGPVEARLLTPRPQRPRPARRQAAPQRDSPASSTANSARKPRAPVAAEQVAAGAVVEVAAVDAAALRWSIPASTRSPLPWAIRRIRAPWSWKKTRA
jgi:hypothetical protein